MSPSPHEARLRIPRMKPRPPPLRAVTCFSSSATRLSSCSRLSMGALLLLLVRPIEVVKDAVHYRRQYDARQHEEDETGIERVDPGEELAHRHGGGRDRPPFAGQRSTGGGDRPPA